MTQPRERMLAYLYGELPSAERADFEAALSEADRRELAALESTLRRVRAGLAADPPPPARVRANLLAAAEAQLKAAARYDSQNSVGRLEAANHDAERTREQALVAEASTDAASRGRDSTRLGALSATDAQQKTAHPVGEHARVGRARRWVREFRGALVLPSLAMAAAAALLVFSRHAVTPEMTIDRGAPKPETAVPQRPVPQQQRPQQPSAAKPEQADHQSARQAGENPTERFAQPPSGWRRAAPTPKAETPPSSSGARNSGASTPDDRDRSVGAPAPPSAARDRMERAPAGTPTASPAQEKAASGDRTATSRPASAESQARDRVGPAPAPKRAAAPGGVRPVTSATTQAAPSDVGAAAPSGVRAVAPAQPAAPASDRDRAPSAEGAAAPPSAAASLEDEASAPAPRAGAIQLDASALERRAQQHEAAGRWAEASNDYRELLARFTEHPHANTWKKRLAISTLQSQPPPATDPQ